MGNLGWYKILTTWSKKVGGPKNLVLILIAGGYTLGRVFEATGKKVIKIIKKEITSKSTESNLEVFTFIDNGTGDNGLIFFKGDKFIVAATHDDVILIEKVNDENNPYFVSDEWLKKVSDYDRDI